MALTDFNLNDQKTQRILLIILIGVLISGALYYFQIHDQIESLGTLEETRTGRQTELNKIQTMKPQLERLRASVEILQVELDSLETIFPDSADVASLITDLTKSARDEKVATIAFKPLVTTAREYYIENSYEVTLLGAYHSIGRVFARIANYDLIVKVDSLDMKASPVLDAEVQEYMESDVVDGTYDDSVRSVLVKFRITTYSSLDKTKPTSES